MRSIGFDQLDSVIRGRPGDGIDVFLFDCDRGTPPAIELDADELQRCSRFATPLLRRRFRACHVAKRAVVGRYVEQDPAALVFVRGRFDKPLLHGGELHFNLSHSQQWMMLAVANAEIGIDCERVDAGLDFVALLPTVAHRDERIADRGVFFRVWARKEAVLKQLGLGFQLSPERVCVPDAADRLDEWQPVRADTATMPLVRDLPAPEGFVSALSAAAPAPIRVFQLLAERQRERNALT